MKSKNTNKPIPRSFLSLMTMACAFFIAMTLILNSCDSTNADSEPKIADVIMKPDEAELQIGQNTKFQILKDSHNIDFSAFAVTESGEQISIPDNAETTWSSTNTAVFSVSDNGTATGQGEGEAFCVIEMRVPVENKLIFVGRDSARVAVF